MEEEKYTEWFQNRLYEIHKTTGWNKTVCRHFHEQIYDYLDSCGYFIGDFNIHNLPKPKDWKSYGMEDFGKWLLDFALQYNMENGKQYKYELIKED